MKVALTGGIACGKSVVQDYLQRYGVPIIDADHITHKLYEEDADLIALVKEHFGKDVINPDGSVNRQKLGNKAFGQPEKLALLSGWIHPKVRQRVKQFFEAALPPNSPDNAIAISVIPVLYESGLQEQYDEVWVVKATPQQQLDRLMNNRGLSEAEAVTRVGSQIPITQKVNMADVVIDNTGTIENTEQQIEALLKNYQWV